ncbi:unnamed protein product [Darwinula stevensoni]|uniref:Uncharacterized protein n=1 Tax=Darwinula stevensoni TaxID=69355 RepID=A0A7R8X3Q9_9CRUS|nr:unnamed protein product [Darwinula stevensoni]CAG0884791.1 unnamed protein product [Darwinula stevensoni]
MERSKRILAEMNDATQLRVRNEKIREFVHSSVRACLGERNERLFVDVQRLIRFMPEFIWRLGWCSRQDLKRITDTASAEFHPNSIDFPPNSIDFPPSRSHGHPSEGKRKRMRDPESSPSGTDTDTDAPSKRCSRGTVRNAFTNGSLGCTELRAWSLGSLSDPHPVLSSTSAGQKEAEGRTEAWDVQGPSEAWDVQGSSEDPGLSPPASAASDESPAPTANDYV